VKREELNLEIGWPRGLPSCILETYCQRVTQEQILWNRVSERVTIPFLSWSSPRTTCVRRVELVGTPALNGW